MISIALLPGDGVGPEVLAGPIEIAGFLEDQGIVRTSGPWPVGTTSFAATGEGLPARTLAACESADAILFGAVGEHPGITTAGYRPESALGQLRSHFDLRVSIREIWRGQEPPLVFVRNLLGGAYGPTRVEGSAATPASDVTELSADRIREVAGIAADHAQALCVPLISVDKANLLATSRLWRAVVAEVMSERGLAARNVYVDQMAYELAKSAPPAAVVVTEGLFGDILSDLAAGRAGSIALCGSASVCPGSAAGQRGCAGLFEPMHGSAPARAGQGIVNPVGGYLALAMLLGWFPETRGPASILRAAVAASLASGPLTYDMTAPGEAAAATKDLSGRINDHFRRLASRPPE